MQNQALKYQLLAELLRSLEAEGFVFGTDKYLQLQELLRQLPEDIPIEKYKEIFAPIICTNDKEQTLFYSIFDQSLERVQAVHEPLEVVSEEIDEAQKWWKWILLLMIPVGLASAYLLYQGGKKVIAPPPSELSSIFFTIQPDSINTICLDDRVEKEKLEKFAPFIQSGMGSDSLAQSLATELGLFEIKKTTCLQYTAKDTIGAEGLALKDSIRLFLSDSLGNTTSIVFYPNIEKPFVEPPTPQSLFETKPYPYPNDIRSLEVESLGAWEQFYAKNYWWLKPLFMLLLAALLWAILKYRDARRRKLIAELESKEKPPYVWNIQIDGAEDIQMNDAFYSILNKLRQRTTDEFTRLDIPKTVKATIQKGGMVDFQYRHLTRPPEYLLLIDQQSGANHRAHLFDFLYRAFKENEIIVERFFFDGDPRLCYNEAFPNGVSLKELQHRYYNSRLLLMGNGYSLLSPLSGKLTKWGTTLFAPWKQRSILTPRATEAWGRKENRLQESFHVLPATLQGLNFLVEQLDAGEDADFSDWKSKIKDAPTQVIELQGGLLTSLRHYFSEDMLQWIAACAVYPSLHWDLTLHIGGMLSDQDNNILTVEKIMEITRLPWFVEGEVPKEARAVLLNYLEEKHPDTLQKIRIGLHELLQQNHPPKDSVAYEDYQMNIALNEWLFTKDKQKKKDLEKEIAKYLEAGIEADFTVIKYLDRERTPLDFIVPNAWKKYVHKAGHVGLGMKDIWKDIFYWALPIWLVLSGMALWYQPAETCEGELVEYQINEEENISLCIDSPADSILLLEYMARKAIAETNYEKADTIIEMTNSIAGVENKNFKVIKNEQTEETRNEEDIIDKQNEELNLIKAVYFTTADSLAYQAFLKNIAIAFYNQGVPLANRADSLKNIPESNSQFLVDSACFFFTKAYALDATDVDIQKGKNLMCEQSALVTISTASGKQICEAPCTLTFISNFSISNDSFVEWNFGDGDGTYSQGNSTVSHTFTNAGEYLVKLRINNALTKKTSTLSIKVTEPNIDLINTKSKVFDAQTLQPINRVLITGKDIRTRTKQDGQFELSLSQTQANAPLSLTFTSEGYKTRRETITFSNTTLDTIQLQPEYLDQDPVLTQQYNEVEKLYNQTIATLRNVQKEKCKTIAEKNIQALEDYFGDFGLEPMQAAVANREQKNIQAVQDFKNKTAEWVKEIEDCNNQPTTNIPRPAMARIPAGTFTMGDTFDEGESDEKPLHEVSLNAFSIGRYEVTFEEYDLFCEATKKEKPEDEKWGRGKRPAINVSWYDAIEYCNWLSEQHGYTPAYTIDKTKQDPNNKSSFDDVKWIVTFNAQANGYCLPTESEWEYAASYFEDKKSRFGNGKDIADPKEINFNGSESYKKDYSIVGTYRRKTVPVGSLNSPNGYGLYDMSGNVYEWCWDWKGDYPSSKTSNPKGPSSGTDRVLRGGSWYYFPIDCRSSYRLYSNANNRNFSIGFRLVRH